MRLFLFPLSAVFAVFVQLAALPSVLAVPIEHPGGYPFPSDERVKQKVKVELQNADNEEFLMTFAKAANLNILVDATEAPADAPPFDIKHESSVIDLALAFAKYRGYTTQRFSTDTLLFWPQIDKKSLAQQLLESHKERWNRELADALPPESKKRAALLREYFEKTLGWDGKWEGVDLRVKVKELPPELRAMVLSEMNAQIAYKGSNIDRLLYRMRDEFWQSAKLTVVEGMDTENNTPAPFLMLNYKGWNPAHKHLNPPLPSPAIHPSDTSINVGQVLLGFR